MTIYMNRLFRKSNSSFLLASGKALKAEVSRFKDDLYVVDAGIGAPKMTMVDELTRVPNNPGFARFENKVGFMDSTAGKSPVKTQMLEYLFMDLVAGEPAIKERAVARFTDLVGQTDSVAGEPAILLPRRFTQNQAWMELKKLSANHKKVRGFILEKVRGGYSVAIGGYIAFLPYRSFIGGRKLSDDRYIIETLDSRRKRLTVI